MARIVLPGLPHHVTHRGNRRKDIFFTDGDRVRYLKLIAHYAGRYSLSIFAYCLMTNHVHFLVVPDNATSMASTIGRTHMTYARMVNRSKRWTGHLWANRYYSAPLEPSAAVAVARYIELNPVRAGITPSPETYRWSSAPAHCRGTTDSVLAPEDPLAPDSATWQAYLRQGAGSSVVENIRRRTSTGTPFGSEDFLARLERTLGKRLARRKYQRRQ